MYNYVFNFSYLSSPESDTTIVTTRQQELTLSQPGNELETLYSRGVSPELGEEGRWGSFYSWWGARFWVGSGNR